MKIKFPKNIAAYLLSGRPQKKEAEKKPEALQNLFVFKDFAITCDGVLAKAVNVVPDNLAYEDFYDGKKHVYSIDEYKDGGWEIKEQEGAVPIHIDRTLQEAEAREVEYVVQLSTKVLRRILEGIEDGDIDTYTGIAFAMPKGEHTVRYCIIPAGTQAYEWHPEDEPERYWRDFPQWGLISSRSLMKKLVWSKDEPATDETSLDSD